MAKRKRLKPANPIFLSQDGPSSDNVSRSMAPIATVAAEASAQAALQEMSETLKTAQDTGRMVISIPLSCIDVDYLVRDRMSLENDELSELKKSLRVRGQQTPIEVTPLDGKRYGLISGLRRYTALSMLAHETGEEQFSEVLALVRHPNQAAQAYLAMVEENEIRVGLSFYERARIAVKTVDAGAYPNLKSALNDLFGSASRAKRSKIKSFTTLVVELDDELQFPHSIGERLGLQLVKAIGEDNGFVERLKEVLCTRSPATLEAEQSILMASVTNKKTGTRSASKTTTSSNLEKPIHPGLHIKAGKNRVSLSGPTLTAKFQERLMDWLKTELE